MIVPQIFPRSSHPRCDPSRRIRRVRLGRHLMAEARQVSRGTFVPAALFRNQLDQAAESPWMFPMAPSLFSEAEAVAAEARARPVPPEREQSFHPLHWSVLPRAVVHLPPSPWNLVACDADDAACWGDVCPRKAQTSALRALAGACG